VKTDEINKKKKKEREMERNKTKERGKDEKTGTMKENSSLILKIK
jgi:hypothetical protein